MVSHLVVLQNPFNFGVIPLVPDNEKVGFFRIRNSGANDTEITAVGLEGKDAGAFRVSAGTTEDIDGLKGIIASGTSKSFRIFFTPPATVIPDITATLVCTASSGKTIRLRFMASTEMPVTSFEFSTNMLDYGTLYPGPDDIPIPSTSSPNDFPEYTSLYLENTGNTEIAVASVMVTGDTDEFGLRQQLSITDVDDPLSLFVKRKPRDPTILPPVPGELIPFEAGFRRPFIIAFKPQRVRNLDVSITITAVLESGEIASMTVTARTSDGITYVNVAATGTNDGSSWQNAYTDLENVLNNVIRGGRLEDREVWVAAGTYLAPPGGFDLLAQYPVKLYGGFAGTETSREERKSWATNKTILDGQGNSTHVVSISIPENGTPIIREIIMDGFYVTGGAALGSSRNNRDQTGGGFIIGGGSGVRSWPYYDVKINNINVHGNKAAVHGSAISCSHIPTTFSNVIVTGNESGAHAGDDESNVDRLFGNLPRNSLIAIDPGSSFIDTPFGNINFINCTITGNIRGPKAKSDSRIEVLRNAKFINCIIWGPQENGGNAVNSLLNSASGTNITGDPMLDSDFRLQAGSPAINTGTNMIQINRTRNGVTTGTEMLGTGSLDYITTDWFGSERIKSGTVDIGAHEF